VLEIVGDTAFLRQVQDTALLLKQKLAALVDRYPKVFADVRGTGLMLGLKAVMPNTEIVAALRDAHLLTVGAGDNVVRLLPPLIIGPTEIDAALTALETACEKLDS
jgi:acetylornithine/N-succinyldiaminopimelate aminotransferase